MALMVTTQTSGFFVEPAVGNVGGHLLSRGNTIALSSKKTGRSFSLPSQARSKSRNDVLLGNMQNGAPTCVAKMARSIVFGGMSITGVTSFRRHPALGNWLEPLAQQRCRLKRNDRREEPRSGKLALTFPCDQPACELEVVSLNPLWFYDAHDREGECIGHIFFSCLRKTSKGKTLSRDDCWKLQKKTHPGPDLSSRTRSRRMCTPRRSTCNRQ